MVYIDRNPMVDEVRSEVKGGGTLPPSGTSGFSWRTILIGVLVIAIAIVAVVFGLPLLFSR